jgi:hypothetical protein
MRILEQNKKEKGVEYLVTTNIYIKVFDYGIKKILKKFRVEGGDICWCWIQIKDNSKVEEISTHPSSFEMAINKAVNNLYTTVYECSCLDEMIKEWNNIKYIDNKITYKGKEE